MSATDAVYGMLSALFAAAAAYGLRRALAPRGPGWRGRVDHLLHTAMALAMAVMPWSWGRALPESPQTVFFAAAALWFPLSAAGPSSRSRVAAVAHRLPHAAGMAAMAWMTHSMAAASHATVAGGLPTAHHAAGSGHPAGEPAAGDAFGALLALLLLACALHALTRDMPLLGRPTRLGADRSGTLSLAAGQPYGHFWDGSMALGTAVMLLMPH